MRTITIGALALVSVWMGCMAQSSPDERDKRLWPSFQWRERPGHEYSRPVQHAAVVWQADCQNPYALDAWSSSEPTCWYQLTGKYRVDHTTFGDLRAAWCRDPEFAFSPDDEDAFEPLQCLTPGGPVSYDKVRQAATRDFKLAASSLGPMIGAGPWLNKGQKGPMFVYAAIMGVYSGAFLGAAKRERRHLRQVREFWEGYCMPGPRDLDAEGARLLDNGIRRRLAEGLEKASLRAPGLGCLATETPGAGASTAVARLQR